MTDALLIAHIAVFGAWFGTDLATFHLSRKVLDPAVAVESRANLAGAMLGVEVVARLCLPVTLALGLTLSVELGYVPWPRWVVWPILLVGAGWVAMVWTIHRSGGTGGAAARLATTDLWFRSAVCLVVLGLGASTLVFDEPFLGAWLGVKLIAFGVIMAIGIRVRFLLRPFSVAFGALVAEGSSPERELAVQKALRRAHPYVVCIWVLLLSAVAMAVIRPV